MCTTNIDNLLNDEDVTLQRLMDEDDIIQECKSNNRKLITFLVKPEILHEMVALVTTEPSSDSPDATRYKYNNIAAELFSCDVTPINDAIVSEDGSLLTELCEFIYKEPPLNPLMASFFSKTVAILISRKADKMLEYLKNKEGFLSQLLKHLQTSAIMDLLLKLVTCVENRSSKIEIAQWLCAERFIERLIGLFGTGSETALHGNAAQLLCDLLRLLRDVNAHSHALSAHEMNTDSGQSDLDTDPIVSTLEAKSTVDLLLEQILCGEVTESSLVHGITVLLTLLEVRRPPQLLTSEPDTSERLPPDPIITPCIRNTVEAIIPRLKEFHQILLHPPEKSGPSMPVSASAKPFGFARLQVTRLIAALIGTGSSEVHKELTSLGTLSVLLEMMLEFHHSNFLHAQVEKSIQCILGLEPIDLLQPSQQAPASVGQESTDGSQTEKEQPVSSLHPLLTHLVTETCLVRLVLEAWEANENHQKQPGGLRRAYMGHLIWIANYITDFGKHGKNAIRIQQLMQDLPEDLRQRWQEFVDVQLAQANRNNEIVPSNMMAPRASSDEEEPDVTRHTLPKDTALQEVFSDYQMEVMSKHVVTQFGFADSQFQDNDDQLRPPPDTLVSITLPEDADELSHQSQMFEQVCNERMQMRPKNHGEEEDENEDEIWLERGGQLSSENTSTVRPESSSDEEETIGEEANDSMDVDQNPDPWATAAANQVAPVAMDSGNPWESVTSSTDAVADDNWANFSKADFSTPCFGNSTPMDISETPASPASAVIEVPPVTSDESSIAVSPSATGENGGEDAVSSGQSNGPV